MVSQSELAMLRVRASGFSGEGGLNKVAASDLMTALGYFLQASRLDEGVIKEPLFMLI